MHTYDDKFFQYIQEGSLQSAEIVVPLMLDTLKSRSVLDVGCGAGAWCSKWLEHGVSSVVGVDGPYVDVDNLLFPKSSFHAHDLSKSFDLEQKFDLAVSLEVAEHINAGSAAIFVENLVKHSDVVLFSAATPGQGGEFHVNEQPLEYWRALFADHGYVPFDYLRPLIKGSEVMPWYRYNSMCYVNSDACDSLEDRFRQTRVNENEKIEQYSDLLWSLRTAVFKRLSPEFVNKLSQFYHKLKIMAK